MTVERFLYDTKMLRGLLVGEDRDNILMQASSEIAAFDPIETACLLRMLIRGLATEDTLWNVDKRDGAIALLGATNLEGLDEAEVFNIYLEAVRQQSTKNDPYAGSIYHLLEAGKILAPHLPKDRQRKQQVINTWKKVAQRFRTIDERLHIRSQIEEIRQRTSPNLLLDSQVEILRKLGWSNTLIAVELERKRTDIEASAQRLILSGRIERARSSSEDIAHLDAQVEQLRKQGWTNTRIAVELGRERAVVRRSAHRLILSGRIKPSKSRRKPKPL